METFLAQIAAAYESPAAFLAIVAVLTPVVGGYVNRIFKLEGFRAAIVPVGLVLVGTVYGCVAHVGFFAEFALWECAVYGVGLALAAARVFDFDWVKVVLDKIGAGQPSVKAAVARMND